MPEVGQILIMEWKLCMEINNRRQKMSIQKMEKYKSLYCRDYPKADIWIASFMDTCIDSLKDLHEENCKIWKELAKLRGER